MFRSKSLFYKSTPCSCLACQVPQLNLVLELTILLPGWFGWGDKAGATQGARALSHDPNHAETITALLLVLISLVNWIYRIFMDCSSRYLVCPTQLS
jgi:hypothetical protein